MKVTNRPSLRNFIFWLGGSLLVARALGVDSVRGGNVRPPPDYYAFVPPEAGGSYVDPEFGTLIKRISDATKTPDVAAGRSRLAFIANEYSTMSPFNLDGTRFLLLHLSYFALYDGKGGFIANLPLDASSEPRWSRRDPSVLFYVSGNQLKQLDVATGTASVARTFPEYGSVRGHGESDICFDGDHLVLAGDGRYIFVYELSTGRKGPVFDTGGRGFDSLYITPDDNVTVTWLERGASRYQGIELFDRDMNFRRQVTRAGGHMDVTRDVDGQDVLVWANAADSRPVCKNGVVKVRLSDGQQTCLLSLDWSLAFHVSAPDGGGWAFVETYAIGDPQPENGWKEYTNEILAITLDGSRIRRFAHHRSRPFNNYWWQPRASVSHDGSKLLYTSDYGLQAILGYPAEYTDAYLIAHVDAYASPATGRGAGRAPVALGAGPERPPADQPTR
jgi:hypothetical protein